MPSWQACHERWRFSYVGMSVTVHQVQKPLIAAPVTSELPGGARSAYLQTVPGNDAALALYEPFGFVTPHSYKYLRPPG